MVTANEAIKKCIPCPGCKNEDVKRFHCDFNIAAREMTIRCEDCNQEFTVDITSGDIKEKDASHNNPENAIIHSTLSEMHKQTKVLEMKGGDKIEPKPPRNTGISIK